MALAAAAVALAALGAPARAETLTLAEAVATALANHPSLQAADAQRDAARARVGEVYSSYLPDLAVSGQGRGDYSNFEPVYTPSNSLVFPFTLSYNYAAGVTLSQRIWDFGRTSGRVASARSLERQAGADLETARRSVELGAVAAFFQVALQIALKQVADEALAQTEQHVAHTKALVDGGLRPELDLLTARTQRAQAALAQVHAASAISVAEVALNAAMGVTRSIGYSVADEPSGEVRGEAGPLGPLVDEALAHRPELESARHAVESAAGQIEAARGDYFPSIGASAGGSLTGTQTGRDQTYLGPFYDVSAQLTVNEPLFSGLQTRRAVQENVALARAARAQLELQRQSVAMTVQQAQLQVADGRQAVTAAEEVRQLAEATLKSATVRYQAGHVTFLELSQAQSGAVNARAQVVTARYGLAASRAQLLRSVGRAALGETARK